MNRDELNKKALTVDRTLVNYPVALNPEYAGIPYLCVRDFGQLAIVVRYDEAPDSYNYAISHKQTGYRVAEHAWLEPLSALAERLNVLDLDFTDPQSPKKEPMRQIIREWRRRG